jgi:Mitochondrial genome maintenance MGM101
MAALARRTLQRLVRQPPQIRAPSLIIHRRPFTVSSLRRQTPEVATQLDDAETLDDAPVFLDEDNIQIDWSRSFHGLSAQAFSEEAAKILTGPLDTNDVEIKPGIPLSFLI